MDWFETTLGPELFEEPEESGERYLLVCVLSDKKSGECKINEFLFLLQNELNKVSSDSGILFHKAFVYGDTRVCIRRFSQTEDQEIYYMDACAEPVPDSHLMIIADSVVKDFTRKEPSSAEPVRLLIIRESEYGIGRADELTLKNYYSGREIPCHLAIASCRLQNDWLEQFVEKQGGKVFSFQEVCELVDYIRS